MDYKELYKPLEDVFVELGYKEVNDNHWVCQTEELILLFSIIVDTQKKRFYIEQGILFKNFDKPRSLKKITMYQSHILQGLCNALIAMGESEEQINKLFTYDPDDNSGFEIKNIQVIMDLYKKKIMPHIKNINDKAINANFDKRSTWKSFQKYYFFNDFNGPFMERVFFLQS